MYFIMITIELFMNISTGIISCSCITIKNQFNLTDSQFGNFSLINEYGHLIGLLFSLCIDNFNKKWVMIFFLIVKSLLLIGFKLTNEINMFYLLRGCIGFVHMPISIYIPLWLEQYGLKDSKYFLLKLYNSTFSIGKFLGYALCYLTKDNVYKYITFHIYSSNLDL